MLKFNAIWKIKCYVQREFHTTCLNELNTFTENNVGYFKVAVFEKCVAHYKENDTECE